MQNILNVPRVSKTPSKTQTDEGRREASFAEGRRVAATLTRCDGGDGDRGGPLLVRVRVSLSVRLFVRLLDGV